MLPSRDHVGLALALALGIGWFGFPGLLWDVAWHRTIGRDSFLSPPHLLMYTGVAVSGLVAGWALLARAEPRLGFGVIGTGFLVTMSGAGLDEWWHRNVGKDVNLWSPPHLVGLAGTVLIVLGLAFAVAGHTRYAHDGGGWLARLVLVFCFADLVHKSVVALDHYTLDPWGRTPDFYPLLLALLLPAIFVTAVRALGPGGATATAVVFTLEHAAILGVLLVGDMRIPTLSPVPVLPALAVDLAFALWKRRVQGLIPLAAGLGFALVVALQETAWMAWVVGRPWDVERVLVAWPRIAVTGIGSACVGWGIGGFVRSAAEGRSPDEVFGSRARRQLALAGMAALAALGLVVVYQPSRTPGVAPPIAALGLVADSAFDYRDAIFWEAQLPDDWRMPGSHRTYQEGIVDGRPFPLGPAWCVASEAALARDLAAIRFELSVNGERVALDPYPGVRLTMRDGERCHWIGVSATMPRPGRYELVYAIRYARAVETKEGTVGPGTARVTIDLVIKQP